MSSGVRCRSTRCLLPRYATSRLPVLGEVASAPASAPGADARRRRKPSACATSRRPSSSWAACRGPPLRRSAPGSSARTILGALLAQAALVAAVIPVDLLLFLAAGQLDLRGVDDDDVVAGVDVGGVDRLVLALEQARRFGRYPAEHLALGVNHVPLPLHVPAVGTNEPIENPFETSADAPADLRRRRAQAAQPLQRTANQEDTCRFRALSSFRGRFRCARARMRLVPTDRSSRTQPPATYRMRQFAISFVNGRAAASRSADAGFGAILAVFAVLAAGLAPRLAQRRPDS